MRLFGERPYAAVSTTDIAREAGVARALLNHYFGTKRDLYLEVVRQTVTLVPSIQTDAQVKTGRLDKRVARAVDLFLDSVYERGNTFVAVIGAEGIGADPEVESILAQADDLAARAVLETIGEGGTADDAEQRAVIRSYGGLVKAAVREWLRDETLTREQVHLLLSQSLLAIVESVLPDLAAGKPTIVPAH